MSSEERFRRVTSAIEDAVTEQMEQLDEQEEEEEDEDDEEEEERDRRSKNCSSQRRPAFVYHNLGSWDNVRLDRWHGLVPVRGDEGEEGEGEDQKNEEELEPPVRFTGGRMVE